jgi:hypothetical protein
MQQMPIGREPTRYYGLCIGLALCAAFAIYVVAVVLLVSP